MRIRSFRHKALKRLYETGDPRGIRADLVKKLEVVSSMPLNRRGI
jgi:plasmid maintenance system killer protein